MMSAAPLGREAVGIERGEFEDSLVREFYKDAQKEWDRLDIPLCRIEFASTLALIDEYMADAAKTVADIGGGPGRYTIELLKRGCSVTLLDSLTREYRPGTDEAGGARLVR
jgi:hypothetical protein